MQYVVLGEALIDLIVESGQGQERRWIGRCGGSPLNVASGLGNLGADVQFLGRFSDDVFGPQLRSHLEHHHVGLEHSVATSDPTTLAIVALDAQGKANYTFHTVGTSSVQWQDSELSPIPEDALLHFGSFGVIIDPAHDVLRAYIAGHPGPKSFDMNVRSAIIPDRDEYVAKVEAFLRLLSGEGNVVKASDEDVQWLTQGDPIEAAARWCERFQLQSVVLTLGQDGAVVVSTEGIVARHPGFAVDVVDTVGAGDTFMAGYLRELPTGDLDRMLTRACAGSAIVCTRQGAQPPTTAEVDAFLA